MIKKSMGIAPTSRIYLVILHGILCCSIGCSKPAGRNLMIGEYQANHQKGLDTLNVKADGSYIHTYAAADGSIINDGDKWSFEIEGGVPRATFSNFRFLTTLRPAPVGYWDVEVEKHWGTLRLCIDPDLNYYYAKKLP